MLKNFVKLFPLRGLRSSDPHKAWTEPAEVKTLSQFGELAVQCG